MDQDKAGIQNNPGFKDTEQQGQIPAPNRCCHCQRELSGSGAMICQSCEDLLINNSTPIHVQVSTFDWSNTPATDDNDVHEERS